MLPYVRASMPPMMVAACIMTMRPSGRKVQRKAFDPLRAGVRDGGFRLRAGSAQLESRSKPNHAAAASPTSFEAQMCRAERALLAPQPAPDCGFGRFNFKTRAPVSGRA